MTTDTKLTALELRLYAVAIVAIVYVVAWRTIVPGHGGEEPVAAIEAPPAAAQPAPQIWLDDMPVAQRPIVAVPPGWHVVSRSDAVAPAPQQPRIQLVRAPARKPMRVRTRSS